MQIHITNLHLSLTESDVQRLFIKFGEIDSVELVRDKLNHRSHGRAYINMPVQKQGEQAIISLHGSELKGKKLHVEKVNYDPAPNASWAFSKYE